MSSAHSVAMHCFVKIMAEALDTSTVPSLPLVHTASASNSGRCPTTDQSGEACANRAHSLSGSTGTLCDLEYLGRTKIWVPTLTRWGLGARYEALDASLLPPLWLVHAADASDSGRVHSDVRRRWDAGEPGVRAAMAEVASLAEQGRCASWPPRISNCAVARRAALRCAAVLSMGAACGCVRDCRLGLRGRAAAHACWRIMQKCTAEEAAGLPLVCVPSTRSAVRSCCATHPFCLGTAHVLQEAT